MDTAMIGATALRLYGEYGDDAWPHAALQSPGLLGGAPPDPGDFWRAVAMAIEDLRVEADATRAVTAA